jgi:pimeloyl-ACP methyl ester carboxylesterase
MGGLIAQQLAERFPRQYQGTLAMCAPLAGGVAQVNYIANVRVVFDYFYPGVVPGANVLEVPAGLDLVRDVLGPVQAAVVGNPTGLGAIARIRQTPLAGANGAELVESLLNAIGYNIRGIDDFLGRTHGHSMFDNSSTIYVGLLPPQLLADLNAKVGRFTATPDAVNYLEKYYTPSGALSMPTVTLHTARDPVVPFFHEPAFAQAVASAGASGRLLQRTVDGVGNGTRNGYGHCAFKTQEMVDAFTALRDWVQTGVRPAS